MRINPIIVLFFVAFLFSFVGLVISIVLPKSDISDLLMNFSLFISATSGIVTVLFSNKLTSSKQWNYVLLGGTLVVISFVVNFSGYHFAGSVLRVSGGTTAIAALGYYVYLNRFEYRNSKWIWFLPLILLGCLFKYMNWTGANIIIFSSLLVISINALLSLFRFRKYTRIQVLLFTIQLVMPVCIAVFYFRYIKLDSILIGYFFTWMALLDVCLQQENRFPENI